jgi:hypothetical protein
MQKPSVTHQHDLWRFLASLLHFGHLVPDGSSCVSGPGIDGASSWRPSTVPALVVPPVLHQTQVYLPAGLIADALQISWLRACVARVLGYLLDIRQREYLRHAVAVLERRLESNAGRCNRSLKGRGEDLRDARVQGECPAEGGALLFSVWRHSRIAPAHVVVCKVVPALRHFSAKLHDKVVLGGEGYLCMACTMDDWRHPIE